MLSALFQIVPLALIAAVTPIGVILSIALHDTPRPRANITAYVVGGALVYVLLAVAGAIFFTKIQGFGNKGNPSSRTLEIYIVVGLLLLGLSGLALRHRKERRLPARIQRVLASVSPGKAFMLGVVVLSPGIRNLLLLVIVLTAVASNNSGLIASAIAIAVFIVIALIPPSAPLIVAATQPPDRASEITGSWAAWLERNAQTLLALVVFLMGVKLLIQGVIGLIA